MDTDAGGPRAAEGAPGCLLSARRKCSSGKPKNNSQLSPLIQLVASVPSRPDPLGSVIIGSQGCGSSNFSPPHEIFFLSEQIRHFKMILDYLLS